MRKVRHLLGILSLIYLSACSVDRRQPLIDEIQSIFDEEPGTFAMAFLDLQSQDSVLINAHEMFHAASTMKTPVMIEVYYQASERKLSLYDSMYIKNEFYSIVDSSTYSLNREDDSETTLYDLVGSKKPLNELVYDMIIVSSNLATNLIIEWTGAPNVTHRMRKLGAPTIQVLRGVEDTKAFEKGLSNQTSAYDLMKIFEALANGKAVSPEASEAMLEILMDQKFNEIIPRYLPQDAVVAHKTGSITGVHHDSGLVILPDGRKYVLVLLSKELEDFDRGTEKMAQVSKLVYDYIRESR